MTDIGPGDIVICVDASGIRHVAQLIEGARYVVRGVWGDGRVYPSSPYPNSRTGVCLVGVINPFTIFGEEKGYCVERFRPLRKSDSKIFREMIKLPEKIVA